MRTGGTITALLIVTIIFAVLMFIDHPKQYEEKSRSATGKIRNWISSPKKEETKRDGRQKFVHFTPPKIPWERKYSLGTEVRQFSITLGGKLSVKEIKTLLARSEWPEKLWSSVLRVAWCESGLDPKARSSTEDYGLMQINFPAHREKVSTPRELLVPSTNLDKAWQVYQEAVYLYGPAYGFQPWISSNHCHHLVPTGR